MWLRRNLIRKLRRCMERVVKILLSNSNNNNLIKIIRRNNEYSLFLKC